MHSAMFFVMKCHFNITLLLAGKIKLRGKKTTVITEVIRIPLLCCSQAVMASTYISLRTLDLPGEALCTASAQSFILGTTL